MQEAFISAKDVAKSHKKLQPLIENLFVKYYSHLSM
jgi:hypothetical protein